MKIASGCTARSYDLQKGYPLKCAGRLDKSFWRGIIDLQDRLRRRVFLGRRPTGRPAKAVRPRTIKGEGRKADPGGIPRNQGSGRPGNQGSGAGTRGIPRNPGKTQEPGKWKTGTREVAREPWGRPGPPRTPGRGVGPTSPTDENLSQQRCKQEPCQLQKNLASRRPRPPASHSPQVPAHFCIQGSVLGLTN